MLSMPLSTRCTALRRGSAAPDRARGTCRAIVALAAGLVSGPSVAAPTPEQLSCFESKIRPGLAQHCYQCHSAEALRSGKLKANLLVDSREGMHKGGESGAAVTFTVERRNAPSAAVPGPAPSADGRASASSLSPPRSIWCVVNVSV